MTRCPADRACTALLRALEPHAGPFSVLGAESRDWASALFVGSRHRLALTLEGKDAAGRAERLRDTLADMEFDLRGGFVADLQVTAVSISESPVLGIEALTIEEAETLAVSRGVRRAD